MQCDQIGGWRIEEVRCRVYVIKRQFDRKDRKAFRCFVQVEDRGESGTLIYGTNPRWRINGIKAGLYEVAGASQQGMQCEVTGTNK